MPNTPSVFGTLFSILGALILFIGILFVAYWATRMTGKRFSLQGVQSKYIELLDQVALGPDRALLLVRVAGKVLLLGVSSQRVTYITELDPNEFSGPNETQQRSSPFSDSLKSAIEKGWGFGSRPKDKQNG